MAGLDDVLRSHQAETLIKNKEKLGPLMDTPEAQMIFTMLNSNTGGNLERAAENAAKGDSAQLMEAIRQLVKNPESAQLIAQLKQKLK